MKTETYKLYSRHFWIFLPNFIKIGPYKFELCRFKVGAFFETKCIRSINRKEKRVNNFLHDLLPTFPGRKQKLIVSLRFCCRNRRLNA